MASANQVQDPLSRAPFEAERKLLVMLWSRFDTGSGSRFVHFGSVDFAVTRRRKEFGSGLEGLCWLC